MTSFLVSRPDSLPLIGSRGITLDAGLLRVSLIALTQCCSSTKNHVWFQSSKIRKNLWRDQNNAKFIFWDTLTNLTLSMEHKSVWPKVKGIFSWACRREAKLPIGIDKMPESRCGFFLFPSRDGLPKRVYKIFLCLTGYGAHRPKKPFGKTCSSVMEVHRCWVSTWILQLILPQ